MKKIVKLLLLLILVLAPISISGQETLFSHSLQHPPFESLIYTLSDYHKDAARDYLYEGDLEGVDICIDIQKELNAFKDPILNGDIQNQNGIIEYYKNNSNDALQYYLKALDIYDRSEYRDGINTIMNNIALIFNHIEDYQSTRKYLVKAIDYTPEDDLSSRSIYMLNLAETESILRNCTVGIRIANDLLDLYDPEQMVFTELPIYGVLISCYNNMDLIEDAYDWVEKGMDLLDDNTTYFDKKAFCSQAVEHYFLKEEYEKVIELGMMIYPPADSTLMRDMYKPINSMAIAATKIGNFDLAIELSNAANKIEFGKETLDREDLITPIMLEYSIFRDNANRDLATIQLSENHKIEKAQRYLIGSLLVISIALIVFIPILFRTRKLRNKFKQELKAKNTKLEDINSRLETDNLEIEKGNTLLDTFISVFAHDLINPFQAILGFSQLMTTDHAVLEEKDFIEYSELLSDTSFQLNQLLTNLKSLSISQEDNEKLQSSKICVGQVVDRIISLFESSAKKKNIKFKLLNHGLDCFGFINNDIIESVIRNIISNAIKFSNTDGLIEIDCEKEISAIEVSIRDFGVGIPENVIESLKEKKQPESKLGTAREKGSGLGLAISIELLESFNGSLEFENNKSGGTQVIIKIPAWNE